MTLELDVSGAAVLATPGVVFFGDHEVPLDEFLDAVRYVLTNTDLAVDVRGATADVRSLFVREVAALREVAGYNPGGRRLAGPLSPMRLEPDG